MKNDFGGMAVIGNGADGGGGDPDSSGGGGLEAAALGDHGYSNLRDHFTATISAAQTITLSAILDDLTIDAQRIVAIGTKAATGAVDWNWIYQRGSGYLGISWNDSTKVITIAGVVLDVADEVAVWIEGPNQFAVLGSDGKIYQRSQSESWDESAGANRYLDVNPIDTRGQPDIVIDETNMADGVYEKYISMERFRRMYSYLTLDGGSGTVTVKIFATVQAGEDPTALTYEDVGTDIFAAASWTADALLADYLEKLSAFTWVMFEITAATGAADDADARIDSYRMY